MNHSPTIPSPPSHPAPIAALDALLTAYRLMMPMAGADPEVVLTPFLRMGVHQPTYPVRVTVRLAGVALCHGEGETAEAAARDALERLREGGAPV